jgi:LCP family protein required for cell wall assembly
MNPSKPNPPHRISAVTALVITSVLVFTVLGMWAGFVLFRKFALGEPLTSQSGPTITLASSTPAVNSLGTPLPTDLPTQVASPVRIEATLKPWDGAGQVNILLLGVDYRDWQEGRDYPRSDTMILLTLDPQNKTAGMLSIPRDMWVAIPGFEHGKINTAYYLGEAYKLPGGGPGLAVQTVEQFLGVPIHYYAQVDFGAFVRFIDEIDGVKVNVPEKITVDLLGGGPKTKKTLKPGVQVLPGEYALAYARDRHTEGGDFDRARRQQQVLMAIRDRILSAKMLPTLIQRAPSLYKELATGIHTNLALDDVIKLALLAKDISTEDIQTGILGKETVIFGFSPDNLSILIPIPDKIHLLRDQLFAASNNLKPETPGSSQERMQAEAARLAISNGSQDPALATRTADYLRGQGANIVQVGQADKAYAGTTLIDHTGNPFMLQYLVELMNIPTFRIYSSYDPSSSVDVEVILGNDWASQNPLQ